MRDSVRFTVLAGLMGILVVACGGDNTPAPDTTRILAILAGDQQEATVGQAVPVAPAVEITNSSGEGVPGVEVTFSVASGGGSLTGSAQTTNEAGVATVGSWTLGTAAGANTLRAMAQGATGSPVTFTATGRAGAPATLEKSAGEGQTAAVGEAVTTSPAVRLTDSHGNPVAGAAVTFAVASGGGSITGGSATTNGSGIATVGSWILGTTPGTNTITATAPGSGVTGSPATFTATGTVGPPAAIQRSAGDDQTARVGQPVAIRPAVRVTDAHGNPVQDVPVTFAVASGGGSVTGASVTTSVDGVAAVGSWTLGTTAGTNTLTASASGSGIGGPVTFTATGVAGAAAEMAKSAGDGQTAGVAQSLPVPPAVRVVDSFGNPVSGVAVTFAVTAGGGSATGTSQTTGGDGVATVGSWTLGTTPGANTMTATAAGSGITGSPATFDATATVGAPAEITKVAGDGQSSPTAQAVPIDPSVRITDSFGNPVPGVEVTFAVASGGGSATGTAQTTDANGTATVGSWTLGPSPGANTMTATAAGSGITGNPATFTATGTSAVPAALAKVQGDAQVQVAGQAVPVAPAVLVTDADGAPVPGVTVSFAVTAGGGSVTGGSAVTDANGVATVASWTLGPNVGQNTLRATATGTGITGNPATFTATGALNPAAIAGTWTGQWTNTTFGSSGPATLTVTVDETARTATLTVDLDGPVFGGSDPPAETATGTYSESGFELTGTSTNYGMGTITLSPTGDVRIVSNSPAPGISSVVTTGTMSETQMNFTFTVTFTSGGGASGVTTLAK